MEYSPIGLIRSSFLEKFGVPRQAGMVPSAQALVKLNPDPRYFDALRTLEQFSHLWIVFHFHRDENKPWRPLTEPPRLDAPQRVGVFASRAPYRPNRIGISAVRLLNIDTNAPGGAELYFSGGDLLDGTPVLDIKPYLPFADSIPDATAGWAQSEIPRVEVRFPSDLNLEPEVQTHIREVLQWDPRPISLRKAYPLDAPQSEGLRFGIRIGGREVEWEIRAGAIKVCKLDSSLK
jgi:tRNA-Thr(GGU) m(6)t(6)A37 methyltransferase TsaA